jgi:hypothetical protein
VTCLTVAIPTGLASLRARFARATRHSPTTNATLIITRFHAAARPLAAVEKAHRFRVTTT